MDTMPTSIKAVTLPKYIANKKLTKNKVETSVESLYVLAKKIDADAKKITIIALFAKSELIHFL